MTDTELAAVLAEKLFGWRIVRLPLMATCGDKDAHLRPDQAYPVLIIVGDLPPECWYTPTGWHDWDIGAPAVVDEIIAKLTERGIRVVIFPACRDWPATAIVGDVQENDPDWKRALVLAAGKAVQG
jgi:hypothetical protein